MKKQKKLEKDDGTYLRHRLMRDEVRGLVISTVGLGKWGMNGTQEWETMVFGSDGHELDGFTRRCNSEGAAIAQHIWIRNRIKSRQYRELLLVDQSDNRKPKRRFLED